MSDYHDDSASVPPYLPDGHWHDDAPPPPRAAAFDLARIAEALPRLGTVLWLERRERRIPPARTSMGARGVLLIDHPSLEALERCRRLTAHTAVTSHGPREWLCFRDAEGDAQAKLFLLPDTDYLAWDEMTAASQLEPPKPEPGRWHSHAAFLRSAFGRLGNGWRARLLTFELRRMPWLRTLDARPPLRVSLLGLELARAIARAEAAELVSPLHAS